MHRFKSYAKVNRFINILEKRKDGFHNIQSLFQFINLYDTLTFKKRSDNRCCIKSNIRELEKNNIIKKSISVIEDRVLGHKIGIDIQLQKRIPLGSGLGGGSSNAATTLHALNVIFDLKLSKDKLIKLASTVGSDVPFFINNNNAWVEGKGDILTNIYISPCVFIMAFSKHRVSTSEMYDGISIESNRVSSSYEDFLNGQISNTFKSLVLRKYPSIKKMNSILEKFGPVYLSGSGGTLFIAENDISKAKEVFEKIPKKYNVKLITSY